MTNTEVLLLVIASAVLLGAGAIAFALQRVAKAIEDRTRLESQRSIR